MMTRDDTHGHARALTHTHTALGSFTHMQTSRTRTVTHRLRHLMHQSPSVCQQNTKAIQRANLKGPTEVLKKMARNAALVVPDGMAHAMPASDTALAWGLESL